MNKIYIIPNDQMNKVICPLHISINSQSQNLNPLGLVFKPLSIPNHTAILPIFCKRARRNSLLIMPLNRMTGGYNYSPLLLVYNSNYPLIEKNASCYFIKQEKYLDNS